MGLPEAFWSRLFGVPRGPIGWVGARLMASTTKSYSQAMAAELDLRSDDELLDVGCGAGGLLADHAADVRSVAGIDVSETQVGLARRRLAERIAAGTAEIVLGDAAALPWDDDRFTVVTSLEALKHASDPEAILREMCRVLRPGGRAVITMGEYVKSLWGATDESGARDAWGIWSWSDADAIRLVEQAGFVDIAVSVLPVRFESRLVRAKKSSSNVPEETPSSSAQVEEAVT